MDNDSPLKAVLVVLLVALVASFLVSASVVILRPIQLNNQLLDRSTNIMKISGLLPVEGEISDEEMLSLFKSLDARIVDIDAAVFVTGVDPYKFDSRKAVNDPETSVLIPSEFDRATLGRRSSQTLVFLVWNGDELTRIILPIYGNGMWSVMYGYIALESDFNTIADMTFYEQNETPGLGDQITHPDWLAQWRGRQIYDDHDDLRFAVAITRVDPGSLSAPYEVDALTGATVTANAVTALVHYWFGEHGYRPFLRHLQEQSPSRPEPAEDT